MNRKSNKGITLIALVITIIVLLILAGVTINMVLGEDGIISQAQDAKKLNEKESEKEIIEIVVAGQSIRTISDKETLTKAEIASEIEAELTKKLGDGLKSVIVNEETGEIVITTSNKTYTLDANMKITNPTISKLKAGDYVNYAYTDPDTNEEKIIKCIVLYDSTSENGVQIITENTVADVTLGSNTDKDKCLSDFNNSITLLNAEAGKYLNTNYATSARCVGTTPTGETTSSTLTCCDIDNYCPVEGIMYLDGLNEQCTVPDVSALEQLNAFESDKSYFLGYRLATEPEMYVYKADSVTIYWNFFDLAFNKKDWDGSFSYTELAGTCDSTNGQHYDDPSGEVFWRTEYEMEWYVTRGLRPVFTLRPDLTIVGGTGESADSAYTLGK